MVVVERQARLPVVAEAEMNARLRSRERDPWEMEETSKKSNPP